MPEYVVFPSGGLVPYISLADRVKHSELVVEGKVVSQECFHGVDGNIYTLSRLSLEKVFKGRLFQPYLEIVTKGGQIEGELQTWSHSVQLGSAQKGIFFLNEAKSELIRYSDSPVYGMFENDFGVITINSDKFETLIYSRGERYENTKELFESIIMASGKEPQIVNGLSDSSGHFGNERTDEKCLNFMFDLSPTPSTHWN